MCTDKTGTLTANRINYHDVYPVNVEKEVLEHILADFASSASVTNRTSEAITEALGGQKRRVVDEVAFSMRATTHFCVGAFLFSATIPFHFWQRKIRFSCDVSPAQTCYSVYAHGLLYKNTKKGETEL